MHYTFLYQSAYKNFAANIGLNRCFLHKDTCCLFTSYYHLIYRYGIYLAWREQLYHVVTRHMYLQYCSSKYAVLGCLIAIFSLSMRVARIKDCISLVTRNCIIRVLASFIAFCSIKHHMPSIRIWTQKKTHHQRKLILLCDTLPSVICQIHKVRKGLYQMSWHWKFWGKMVSISTSS